MKVTLFASFEQLFIGTFCQESVADVDSRAVEITTPVNHTVHLEGDSLKPIREADDFIFPSFQCSSLQTPGG